MFTLTDAQGRSIHLDEYDLDMLRRGIVALLHFETAQRAQHRLKCPVDIRDAFDEITIWQASKTAALHTRLREFDQTARP